MTLTIKPVGMGRSRLKKLNDAPRFYTEGAPDAWIDIKPSFVEGLLRMQVGDKVRPDLASQGAAERFKSSS